MKEIDIEHNSGTLSATLFDDKRSETVLIIASATGVKQEFYLKFAKYLENKGITVITFDYNGIGRSLKKPIKELQTNAADWGRNDLESIIRYVINNYPSSKKVILGHSIGGQLIGLAESSYKLDKVILVAAQSGYWKYWKGIERIKMWFNWYILFPILLKTFGYLKSKRISGMENLPKNVAEQWRNWGKHKDYIFSDKSIKETFYQTIEADMTAYSIDDDNFAPKEAVQWMTDKYKNAKRKSVHLNPIDFKAGKIGHFGMFKEHFKNTIWPQILNEIK
ncbi:alpha/beta hydrolase family protein [Maribacter thermophilus]|uniref:alpha/beta hydrolase family protein n=1 Tax=Maribacter thermophilus TaxID=1197874 RepID=UPI000640FA6D|nr:alpha/beta fold hydrolase [Maribacter thermophilus]